MPVIDSTKANANRHGKKISKQIQSLQDKFHSLSIKKNKTSGDKALLKSTNKQILSLFGDLKESNKVDDELLKLQGEGPVKRANKSRLQKDVDDLLK